MKSEEKCQVAWNTSVTVLTLLCTPKQQLQLQNLFDTFQLLALYTAFIHLIDISPLLPFPNLSKK